MKAAAASPLTTEEQLRVVCDAWLSADATNRCTWSRGEADHLVLLFGRLGPGPVDLDGFVPWLLLSLRLEARDLDPDVLAWTKAGDPYRPGWTWFTTPEAIAARLGLEIDWKGFEPF